MPKDIDPGRPPASKSFGVVKVFPDLSDDLLLNLFHKGAKATWTSRDLDWEAPLMSERKREALAHMLTPIYLGEQTAMAGASAILPQLLLSQETTAALYLTSFVMDEARHFEALTRLYRHMGQEPLSIRKNPWFLRYHHRIRQGDRADWVWGILFSDVIAKHFYRSFGVAQDDPLFGEMSKQILTDESRHLAFADHYLRKNVRLMDPARRQAMVDLRDDLYRILEKMADGLRPEAAEFHMEAEDYVGAVMADVDKFARRIGLTQDGGGPPDDPNDDPTDGQGEKPVLEAAPAAMPAATPAAKASSVVSLSSTVKETAARCFGCLIATLCGRRASMA